jgi:CelD/BcsL family acetyltransferase involved in cellulose biosynthesis
MSAMRAHPLDIAAGEVKTASTRAQFDALEPQWRALEEISEGAVLFQSFDWCRNFLDHAQPLGQIELRIFTFSDERGLAALLPLAMQEKSGIKVMTGLSEPFQQYTDMLARPGIDVKAAFAAMLTSIRAGGADSLHLGQVRHGSTLHRAIDGVVPVSGEADGAPFVPIGDFASFDAYHKTVNAKTRKNMRNARNRLERDAPVRHDVARSGEVLAQVIDRSFEGREAWLGRQGLTSRAFRDSGFGAFLARFKQPGTIGIDTIAFALMHGDKPVADQWGFVHKGRYYAFMAGWDEAYEEASPGKMHLGEILEACHGEGIKVADFLIPAARYKFTWANEAVAVQDHVMALSLRGKLHNSLWLNFTRPLAKRAVYAMPPQMRAALFKAVMPSLA